jgi:spore coat protein CotH
MKFNRLPALFFLTSILLGQELFDPYDVHTLDIEFYNPDYDSILQARWEVDDKTYELATVIFNGEQMDSVGVRYKGNSTFWWAQIIGSPKFPLNIDFDLIYEDQDLMGYNKVKLSNSIFDPTFVKESTGYLTEGYYLSTPEVGYMNVSVNGELLGLYVAVETVSNSSCPSTLGITQALFSSVNLSSPTERNTMQILTWFGMEMTPQNMRTKWDTSSNQNRAE